MKERVEFKRDIGLFMAVMIGIGAMMGPGIFALPAELAHMVGPLGILVYLAMGLLTIFTALNYSELGAGIPIAGGGYSFVSRTLPKPIAFFTGWFLWIGNTLACAMYAIIFALSVKAYLWPDASLILLAAATTFVFLITNLRGMSESIKVITIMNLVELVILIGIAVIGVFKIDSQNYDPIAPMGYAPFIPAMALIYISYVGFDLITVAAEEIKNPGKTIPRAILITLGVGIAIYVFVVGVMMGTVHYSELSHSPVPFIFSAERIFGGWGRVAGIVATIMASLSAFSVTLGASARILYALGRDRHFPSFFERLHPRYKTPHVALYSCALIVIAFSASGLIKFVASVADFGYLMGLGIVNCSVIALHKKMPNLRRPFKGFLYPWIPILGAVSCWVFVPALELRSLVLGVALTLVGAGIYLAKATNRKELAKLAGLSSQLKQWIMRKRRKSMKVLIIGGGRHGRSVANQLLIKDHMRLMFRSAEHQITFVEKDELLCQELEQQYNVPIYHGDGTKKDLLRQVGTENIDVAVMAMGNDDQNVIAALQVKRMGVDPVIALVDEPDYISLLQEEDVVAISTHKASAVMIENYLERPDVAELFELGKGEGGLAGVLIADHAGVVGKTIQDVGFPLECIVAAVIRGKHFIVPRGNTQIKAGDRLLFSGLTAAIQAARELCMVQDKRKQDQRGSFTRLVEWLKPRSEDRMDRQLSDILKTEKDKKDSFDELIERAWVLDLDEDVGFDHIVERVAGLLSKGLDIPKERLSFTTGSCVELMPGTGGIAIPHLRLEGIERSELVLVRAIPGCSLKSPGDSGTASADDPLTNALFFLASPGDKPAQHLRILARIAECVDSERFMKDWLTAENEAELRATFVERGHFRSLTLRSETHSSDLIGKPIRDVDLPKGSLVTVIHRHGKVVVPDGDSVLNLGDRLTMVGDHQKIKAFCERYNRKA